MRTNVEAVLERDAKISMMDDRADALHQGASQFETQAAKLKNKFWLENMKYMIALGIVALIVIGVAVCKYTRPFPLSDSCLIIDYLLIKSIIPTSQFNKLFMSSQMIKVSCFSLNRIIQIITRITKKQSKVQ